MEALPIALKRSKKLISGSTCYKILDLGRKGYFATIVKCLDITKDTVVAVKVHKGGLEDYYEQEMSMLHELRSLDPDRHNIVHFIEDFRYQNLSCLVFEMLDKSLSELMETRKTNPLTLNEIRPVTQQLMVALDALKGCGIIHTDLKMDNIMLVDHNHQPFKVKVIDFGLAILESKVELGIVLQPITYRSPEVILKLPLSTAIDMWSLGCIIAQIYFGKNMFNTTCPYKQFKVMLHMLGQPDHWSLEKGLKTNTFFTWEDDPINPGWRLNTPEEYTNITGVKPKLSSRFFRFKNLEDALQIRPLSGDPVELKDRQAFLSFLKCCLYPSSEERIIPKEALSHDFITMAHLIDGKQTSTYAHTALQLMTVCSTSHKELDTSLNTENDKQQESYTPKTSTPECGSNKDWDIWRAFNDDNLNSEASGYCNIDLYSSSEDSRKISFLRPTIVPSLLQRSSESPHSTDTESFSDMSGSEDSSGPSAAVDFHKDIINPAPPSNNTDVLSANKITSSPVIVHSSVNEENDFKPESPHPAHNEQLTDMSSSEKSTGPGTAVFNQ